MRVFKAIKSRLFIMLYIRAYKTPCPKCASRNNRDYIPLPYGPID